MENATKALLMAAGILIAIIILSIAIVVYGRISGLYQAKQNNISQEQLAAFNGQYTVYDRSDVTGFELVGLINKIADFNQNKLDQGYEEMSISVKINELPNGKLFGTGIYIYDGKNSSSNRKTLLRNITEMQNLEAKYGAGNLTKLVSNMSYLTKFGGDGTKEIRDVLGKDYTLNDLDKEKLLKYEDYLSFKRAEYKCLSNQTEYKNGQIVKMSFEQN